MTPARAEEAVALVAAAGRPAGPMLPVRRKAPAGGGAVGPSAGVGAAAVPEGREALPVGRDVPRALDTAAADGALGRPRRPVGTGPSGVAGPAVAAAASAPLLPLARPAASEAPRTRCGGAWLPGVLRAAATEPVDGWEGRGGDAGMAPLPTLDVPERGRLVAERGREPPDAGRAVPAAEPGVARDAPLPKPTPPAEPPPRLGLPADPGGRAAAAIAAPPVVAKAARAAAMGVAVPAATTRTGPLPDSGMRRMEPAVVASPPDPAAAADPAGVRAKAGGGEASAPDAAAGAAESEETARVGAGAGAAASAEAGRRDDVARVLAPPLGLRLGGLAAAACPTAVPPLRLDDRSAPPPPSFDSETPPPPPAAEALPAAAACDAGPVTADFAGGFTVADAAALAGAAPAPPALSAPPPSPSSTTLTTRAGRTKRPWFSGQ